jgi:O-antigen/teichoic acid export membrane protein
MRVKNSIINISTGIGSQIILTLLSFISRTVFITYLGIEYLGINGLFTNIFSMLSLAEAGIGTAITYTLYKPVADNNQERIIILLRFYRKAYLVIAIIILILGFSLLPFLEHIIKDSKVEDVYLIFIIFLLNTAISYLFAHKISFLNVCQKNYIVTGIYLISSILSTVIKITILVLTQNYILFLILEGVISIITAIVLSNIIARIYPFLKQKISKKLDKETMISIQKNVKALIIHKIGGYAVFGTDNILIASYVSIAAVGLYSNYYMLINISRTLINQIFNNINHSIGNLVAKENEGKIYDIFKVVFLCNFWIYSFLTSFLYIIIDPFIEEWLGSDYLMSQAVLIILMINFYFSGMRRSISMFKSTAGIFQQDRYAPFIEAIINLGVSIVLVQYMDDIVGIFIGTFISTLLVPFWIAPYLVYKQVFKIPVYTYFLKYIQYLIIGVGTCLITSLICNLVTLSGVLGLMTKGTIAVLIPNLIYILLFHRNDEFRYILAVIRNFASNKVIKRKYTFHRSTL